EIHPPGENVCPVGCFDDTESEKSTLDTKVLEICHEDVLSRAVGYIRSQLKDAGTEFFHIHGSAARKVGRDPSIFIGGGRRAEEKSIRKDPGKQNAGDRGRDGNIAFFE